MPKPLTKKISRLFDLPHKVLDYLEALLIWLIEDRRFADSHTVAARLDVCETCPLNRNNICEGCGCNIGPRPWWARFTSKVYFPSEKCPEGNW